MNQYYVYDLIDPRTNETFYVGKGQGARMYNHVSLVRNNKQDHNVEKCKRISEILNEGLEVIHRIIDWFSTDTEALTAERDRIKQLGRVVDTSGPLLNMKCGDEKPRKTERPINQCDFCTGRVIATYPSTKTAAQQLGIRWVSSLSNAVQGKTPSYAGYIWHYVGDPVRLPTTLIYQWSTDGTLVHIHKNEGDASRAINCAQAHLHTCIATNRPCKGYIVSKSSTFPGVARTKPHYPVWKQGLRNKSVLHINTNTLYPTVTEAAKATKHNIGHISACCLGKRTKIGDDVFRFVAPQNSPTAGA